MKKHLRRLLIAVLSLTFVLAMGTAVFADEDTGLSDGRYDATVTSTLGMFKIQSAQVEVNGEDATLIINSTNADRYGEIYLGEYGDITEENKDSVGVKGEVIDADKKIIQFVIPIKTADLASWINSENQQNSYVLRYVDPYPSKPENAGKWYEKTDGSPYYLTLSKLTLKEAPLTIINKATMFNAVSASLLMEEGGTSLVVALNKDGYQHLFKGTKAEAIANGNQRENWIAGQKNEAGKWEFVIPLGEDETYVPCVAISKKYLDGYDNRENELEKVFYPRQFTVNRDARTLLVDDCVDETYDLTVINSINMFKPGEKATYVIAGGPNSDNYKQELTLNMGSGSMTKVRNGEAGAEIELGEGNSFAGIPVVPNTLQKLQFFSGKNQVWYNRYAFVDLDNKTVSFADFTSVAIEPVSAATYTGATQEPDVTVKLLGCNLTENVDYKVTFSNNKNAGTAQITVQGTGTNEAEQSVEFTINPAPLSAAAVSAIKAVTYNGKKQTPAVTVKFGGKTLTKNKDYKAEYKNNLNSGKATVTLTGMGNFKGSKTVNFTINPAVQKLTISAAKKTVKFSALKKKAQQTSKVAVKGAKEKAKVTYAKVKKGSSAKLTINKTTGKIKVAKGTKKGTYKIKVKVTAAKTKNYKAASATKVIKVIVK